MSNMAFDWDMMFASANIGLFSIIVTAFLGFSSF